jgi:hypothetical protein
MPWTPKKPPDNPDDLSSYLDDELSSISSAVNQGFVELQVQYKLPTKPVPGLIVYADGTRWNPANGEGINWYDAAHVWHTAAKLDGPSFTGVPLAPTAAAATNTTQIATTAFVTAAVAAVPDPTASIALKSDKTRTFHAFSATTLTLALTDADEIVNPTSSSAVTITVPPNSSVAFPIGTQIDIIQSGTGKVTIAAGVGVTINSLSSNKSLAGLYAGGTLIKGATDIWLLIGSLIP